LELNDFTFTQLGGFANGDYLLFDTTTAIVGNFGANVTGSLGGSFTGTLQFADGGNDIILHVVPEPGSSALLLVSGLGLMARRRRRQAAAPATNADR
jgi:PEP-CTERM motif